MVDFSRLYSQQPEVDIPEPLAKERASMVQMSDNIPYELAIQDITYNGNQGEVDKKVREKELEARSQSTLEAKRSIVLDPELDEEIKLDAVDLPQKLDFSIDYRQRLVETFVPDTEGLSDKEVNAKLNTALEAHGTTLFDEIKAFNTAKVKYETAMTAAYAKEAERLAKAQLSSSGSQAVLDFAGTLVMGQGHKMWLRLHEHLYGEYPDWDENIAHGRVQEKIKSTIKTLPLDQRYAFMRNATQWVVENSGMVWENDLQATFVINDILEDALSGDDNALSEWMNSIVGVADTAGLGFVTKSILTGIFKSTKSALLGTVLSMDKKKAKEIAKAIEDGTVDPEDLGINSDLLNTAVVTAEAHMPNSFVRQLTEAKIVTEELAEDLAHNTLMYSDDSLDVLKHDYQKIIDETYGTIPQAETKIDYEGDDFVATVTLTNTENSEFTTVREAVEEAQKHFTNYVIKAKTNNGDYVPLTNPAEMLDEAGEFVIEFQHKMPVSDIAKIGSQKISQEDIRGSYLPNFLHKYFTDSTTGLSPRLSRSIDTLLDMSQGAQARMRSILKPYSSLSALSQHRVITTINEFIRQKKEITYNIIDTLPLSKAEKEGIWSFKLFNEGLYHLYDARLVRDWNLEGVRQVTIPYLDDAGNTLKFKSYGKRVDIDDVPYETTRGEFFTDVYDPLTDKVRKVSWDEIQEAYDNGGFVVRVKEDLGSSLTDEGVRVVTNYVLATPGSSLTDLGPNVLRHKNAYGSARYHTNNLYVREKRKILRNGEYHDYYTARAGADSWEDAAKLKDKMLEAHPNREYEITYSRELTPSDQFKMDNDILMTRGRIGFSKRMEDNRPGGIEGLQSIEDPMVSAARSLQSIANKETRGDVVQWLENQWMNTYGRFNPRTQQAGFPESEKAIRQMISDDKLQDEAIKLFNKVQTLKQVHLTSLAEDQKRLFLKWAKRITDEGTNLGKLKWRGKASDALIAFSDKPVEQYLKALPFWFYIAGNPTRQYLLQGQQSLFVASTVPEYAPKVFMDAHRLGAAYQALKLKNPDSWPDKAALAWAREYQKSGMHEALASSGIAAEVNIQEAKGLTKQTLGQKLHPVNLIKSPWLAGRYGMLAGEAVHQRTAWLSARKLFEKEMGYLPKSRKDYQAVNARARQLALSMQAQSSFGFQQGWAGMLTQFMGVQMKGMNAMFFNPAFKGLRPNVILSQMGLYGSRTIPGLLPAIERQLNDVDLDPEIRTFLKGGMADTLAYMFWDEAYLMSKDMSVTGGMGLSMLNLAEGFAGSHGKTPLDFIPALGAAGQLYDFVFNKLPMIAGMGLSGKPLGETATLFVENYARLSSGFSNYTIARSSYAAQELITKGGLPTGIKFEKPVDFVLKGAFGLDTSTEEEAWRLVKEQGFLKNYMEKDLQDDVNAYVKHWRSIMFHSTDLTDTISSYDDFRIQVVDRLHELEAYIRWANPDHAETIITNAMRQINATDGRRVSDKLNSLVESMRKGQYTKERALELGQRFRDSKNLTPEQMNTIEDVLDAIQLHEEI